ncbi:MAG: hypothetical protein PHO32_10125 [Candidatus Cloacimonetes bacterium]|nr:hypothetical protein [Candidatus Cloacimonadota bacterium]
MKQIHVLILAAVILMLLAACTTNTGTATPKMATKYDIALTKVVRSADTSGRNKAPVADSTLVNKLRYRYEDDMMRTIWSASENGFELTLYNASEKNIAINWEQGLYLDYDNIGHRLIISATKDSEKEKPQAASVIPPRGNLVETIFSADHISLSSMLGIYVHNPLLPTDYASAVRYKGKEMKVILPVVVDGVSQNYEHTFKVINVRQVAVKSSSIFGL